MCKFFWLSVATLQTTVNLGDFQQQQSEILLVNPQFNQAARGGAASPGARCVGGVSAGLEGPREVSRSWLVSGAVGQRVARGAWTLSIWASSRAGASSQHVGCLQGEYSKRQEVEAAVFKGLAQCPFLSHGACPTQG